MTFSLIGAVLWMWIQRVIFLVPHLQYRCLTTVANPLANYGIRSVSVWLEKNQLPIMIVLAVMSVAIVISGILSWSSMKHRWMFRLYMVSVVCGMLAVVGLVVCGLPIAPINQISAWQMSAKGMLLLAGVTLIWLMQMIVVCRRRQRYVLSMKEKKVDGGEPLLPDEIRMESGEFCGVKFSMRDAAISIGTDPKYVNLVIDDPELSRIHCVIGYDAAYDQCYCVDHSRNGVFIEQNECIKRVRPQQTCWIPGGSTLILAHSLCRIKVGEGNGENEKD